MHWQLQAARLPAESVLRQMKAVSMSLWATLDIVGQAREEGCSNIQKSEEKLSAKKTMKRVHCSCCLYFSCCILWCFCASPVHGDVCCLSLPCSGSLVSQSAFEWRTTSSTSSSLQLGFWRTAQENVCRGWKPLLKLYAICRKILSQTDTIVVT